MVLYWKTLVLLNESVVFWIAGGCEAHPCVHIKMAGVHTRGFRNIPIYIYIYLDKTPGAHSGTPVLWSGAGLLLGLTPGAFV